MRPRPGPGRASAAGNGGPDRGRPWRGCALLGTAARAGRARPVNVSTVRPSRSTVTLSATRRISPSLCEISTQATPWSRSRHTRSSRWSLSASLSAAVGSSRISSRTSLASALAISTNCCLPTPRSATRVRGSSARPTRASSADACRSVSYRPMTRAPGPLVAEEDVLRHRQTRHQCQFLVHDDDAAALTGPYVPKRTALTAEADLTGVTAVRIHPAEHLHQGRLARAVLPADGVDLPGAHRQPYAVQRGDAAELLGDAVHFQDGRVRTHHLEPAHRAPPRSAAFR
ncbi:hypothetical protein SRIMM317S_04365 [Streptomyces rimosus subsp. rimosus]